MTDDRVDLEAIKAREARIQASTTSNTDRETAMALVLAHAECVPDLIAEVERLRASIARGGEHGE